MRCSESCGDLEDVRRRFDTHAHEELNTRRLDIATILVVDDLLANRAVLVTVLRHHGHRLFEATDGVEALAAVQIDPPDLVITDVLMPVMDGYEFVRQLRSEPATRTIPVVFYTAHYGEREARALARSLGVSYVLTKPAESQVVLEIVDRVLSGESETALSSDPAELSTAFDREHLRLLTDKLSETVGDVRTANARLRALINIGLELASERDVDRLLQHVCIAARDLFGATYVTLGILDRHDQTVQRFSTYPADAAKWIKTGDAVSGILATVVAERRTLRGHNPGGDPAGLQLPALHPYVQAFLAAPIASPEQVYGWICLVGNEDRTFTEEDEAMVLALAGQVGRIYETGHFYNMEKQRADELDREILHRKEAESALREERDGAQRYLDTAQVMLIGLDLNGRITLANHYACALLGWSADELIGRDWIDTCVPAPIRGEVRQKLQALVDGDLSFAERHVVTKSGEERLIEWSNQLLRHEDGRVIGMFSSGTDMTDRHRLQEQLRQAQKMEAIGHLAGGIAHDFNNLLTAILGYSQLLTEQIGPDKPIGQDLQEIMKAAQRATALTQQLLAFSRRQPIAVAALDLNQVIGNLAPMLRRLLGEQIILTAAFARRIRPVMADATQLEQLLMNLAVNARDAMPHGGTLTIETRDVDLDVQYAATHTGARPGAYAHVSVGDTGGGMSPEIQARIFEPFFTTKELGRGTGMGLAAVYGIVKQLGGYVSVEGAPGQGTVFHVYLPETHEIVQPPAVPAVGLSAAGTETILLVEDEDAVRAFIKTVLQRFGYRVFEASNAEAALTLLDQIKEPVHLLMTDVTLPKMDGPELALRVTRQQPLAHVLFISGYPERMTTPEGFLATRLQLLEKPFTAQSLLARVRQLLG